MMRLGDLWRRLLRRWINLRYAGWLPHDRVRVAGLTFLYRTSVTGASLQWLKGASRIPRVVARHVSPMSFPSKTSFPSFLPLLFSSTRFDSSLPSKRCPTPRLQHRSRGCQTLLLANRPDEARQLAGHGGHRHLGLLVFLIEQMPKLPMQSFLSLPGNLPHLLRGFGISGS